MKKIQIPFTSKLPKNLRKATALIVGGTLILLGVLLSVLPGPFTIPLLVLGFAVLASEFAWAEEVFQKSLDGAKIAGGFIKHPLVLTFILVTVVTVMVLGFKYGWFVAIKEYVGTFEIFVL